MHSPRPYGLHTLGGVLTDNDLTFVDHVARRLTNLKDVSGVQSLKMVYELPDGGSVIVQDAGGNFRVIAYKQTEQNEEPIKTDGLAKDYVPMLYSGVVTNAILRDGEGLGMKLTEQCRRRVSGYAELAIARDVRLKRFRIDYDDRFFEFKPEFESALLYTQYAQLRPTWYSGAMAEVMQIVGGYGQQTLEDISADSDNEPAKMLIPTKYIQRIQDEIKDIRLPGYTGVPESTGQFKYDYKFNSNNAIGFDTAQKPWLLKIDASGVWAMPLPLIPATATVAFREWMEEVGDQEIINILNRFGGMPSGETFPISSEIAYWKRAGVVIKVCDVADFYNHIMYSTACGWSFNSKGNEAFNTCYDYYDDEGLGYGLSYKMRLYLQPATYQGNQPTPEQSTTDDDKQKLSQYLSELLSQLSETNVKTLAIKYKMRRVPLEDILSRARNVEVVNINEVNYWDNLELPPIAMHSGNVAEVGRGYLYHGAKFQYQPQIKYPEPLMKGCISHDFLPLENGRYKSEYPKCETIMFGYYIGDSLKVVKYFANWGSYKKEVENDYDECMIVGSWTQTETEGNTSIQGYFYTSDFDYRDAFPPVVTVTKTVGKDRGYDSKPWFSFDDFFWRPGTIWRNRYYTHETKIVKTSGKSMSLGICIPFLCRNAILHARALYTSGSSTTESLGLYSVRDPYSYRYWTNHSIWAWIGGLSVMNGKPYPVQGNPVWVEIQNYNPTLCSDFADQGPWIANLPADYDWLVHPDNSTWQHSGGGGAPKINAYSNSKIGPSTAEGDIWTSILDQGELVYKNLPNSWYFTGSPDESGGVFYRDACRIVFGDSEYANVSESDGDSARKKWGYCSLVDHKNAYHFVGVINE